MFARRLIALTLVSLASVAGAQNTERIDEE